MSKATTLTAPHKRVQVAPAGVGFSTLLGDETVPDPYPWTRRGTCIGVVFYPISCCLKD